MSTEIKETVDYSKENFAIRPYTGLGNYKALTQEQKNQFNSLTVINAEVKKQALAYIIKIVKDNNLDSNDAIKGAIAAVSRVKGNKDNGTPKKPIEKKSDILNTIFVNVGDSKSALDMFISTKMGELSMKMACVKFKEATGKVVSFDAEKETYTLTAINPIVEKLAPIIKTASTDADDDFLSDDLDDIKF